MDKQIVKAVLRYARLSPRKVRMIAALVRGKKVTIAQDQLKWQSGNVSPVLLKLLNSAVANAVHNSKLDKEDLIVKSITVDSGPVLKRFTPKAFGRATPIRKPTSHITIVLSSTKASIKKEKIKDEKVKNEKVKNDENKLTDNKNIDQKTMINKNKKDKLTFSVNQDQKLSANKPKAKITK